MDIFIHVINIMYKYFDNFDTSTKHADGIYMSIISHRINKLLNLALDYLY